MFFATNRSLLAVLVLASSTLLAGATLEGPGSWSVSVNPTPVTQGSTVTVEISKAPSFPVYIEFTVDGVVQGGGTIAEAGGKVTITLSSGVAGQTWEAACSCSSSGFLMTGTVAP